MFIGFMFLKYNVGIIADIIVTIIIITISIDSIIGLKDKTVIVSSAGFFTNATRASTISLLAYVVKNISDAVDNAHITIPTKTI